MKPSLQYILLAFVCATPVLWTPSASLAVDFERNVEKSFQVTTGSRLNLDADRGSVIVSTDTSDKVQVRVFQLIKGGTKEDADELFANHEVTLKQDGNLVSIVAKNKKQFGASWGFNRHNLQVRFEIHIPAKFDVDLATSGGNITVGDLEGFIMARTSSGAIKLGRVSGKVDVKDSGGNVAIEDGGADVIAQTSSGSIELKKVAGKLEASDSGGNIRIGDAGGDVVARTSSGSIKISTVRGDVDLKNSGGDISLESTEGNVKASTSSGSIRLGSIKGKEVAARNSGGNISISDAGGNVSAETSSGSLKIDQAKGDVIAKNSGGDIALGDIGNNVTAQTSSGSIRVKLAKGALDLRNSGGNISVEDAGGELNLSTSSGTIHIGHAAKSVTAKNSGGSIQIADAQNAVTAQTSSGEVVVNFSVPPKGESRVDVSGGGIKVGLPTSAGIELDAQSSGGRVVSEKSLTITVQGDQSRGSLRGKLNGGGPLLHLRSSSGDIRISDALPLEAEARR